jgi:hypothetical protein
MFAFDRETATMVAVVVCIAATVYMFREMRKTKDELSAAIAAKQQPIVYMEPTPVAAAPLEEPAPEPAPAPAPPPSKPPTTRKKQVTISEPNPSE